MTSRDILNLWTQIVVESVNSVVNYSCRLRSYTEIDYRNMGTLSTTVRRRDEK